SRGHPAARRQHRAWCLERQLDPSNSVSGGSSPEHVDGRSVHLNLRQSVAAQLAGEPFRRYPRPGAVTSPGCHTLTAQVTTSSTSGSVPVTFTLLSRVASSTFANTGIVCRRSTTPITLWRGASSSSRAAVDFIGRFATVPGARHRAVPRGTRGRRGDLSPPNREASRLQGPTANSMRERKPPDHQNF